MLGSKNRGMGLGLAFALCAACGGDETGSESSATASASQGAGAGPSATGAGAGATTTTASGGGAAGAGGSSGGAGGQGTGGQGVGGGPITGCANGGVMCPEGLMCCTGVPYPPEGACYKECNLDSDRNIKEAFQCVDREQVLKRLAALDVSEWSYRRDGVSVRHVGPMAQDFRDAFGLGVDAEHIHTIDAQGVTIAAVQALYVRLQDLERENDRLRRDQGALERRLQAMERPR